MDISDRSSGSGFRARSVEVPGSPGQFEARLSCDRMGEVRTDIRVDRQHGYRCGHPECACLADSKAAASGLADLVKSFAGI